MKSSNNITLHDIAQKLNLSVVTVSKVLRGHPDISDETAIKVKNMAEKLGYLPNLMARSLSTQRSNTIGVIVPNIIHPFFASMLEAMYDTAIKNRYEIILAISQDNSDREMQQLRSLLSMQVDGIVISVVRGDTNRSAFKRIIKEGKPLTFVDRVLNLRGANKIVVEDFGGAYAATRRAIELGYDRIGYIGGTLDTNIAKHRLLGYKKALHDFNIPYDDDIVIKGGFGEQDGYDGFMKLRQKNNIPKYIFAAGSLLVVGVFRAIQHLEMKIPNDIDVVAFGVGAMHHPLLPHFSFIEQPSIELGKLAIEITIDHIEMDKPFTPRNIVLPYKERFADISFKKAM